MIKLIGWLFKMLFRFSILFVVLYLLFKVDTSKEKQVKSLLVKQKFSEETQSGGFKPWFSMLRNSWDKYWAEAPTLAEELQEMDDNVKDKFIKRFQRVAVVEQKKFGIPASVIIASSLLLGKRRRIGISEASQQLFFDPSYTRLGWRHYSFE